MSSKMYSVSEIKYLKKVLSTPGVYTLYDIKGVAVYVGSSVLPITRVNTHNSGSAIEFSTFSILECDPADMLDIEAMEIVRLNTKHNKILPRTSKMVEKKAIVRELSGDISSLIDLIEPDWSGNFDHFNLETRSFIRRSLSEAMKDIAKRSNKNRGK
jgi:hypothetical protein